MGQKINPTNFRIGTLYGWKSKWFNQRRYREYLREDLELRKYLKDKLIEASIEEVTIDRSGDQMTISIFSSRPGVLIGRQGDGIETLKADVSKFLKGKKGIRINIEEVRQPELSAPITAHMIVEQIEKRVGFRRAVKQMVDRVIQGRAQGVRINVAGRLDGAEMSRSEWFADGKIPLQTIRADIDYAEETAHTTYGVIGVKVWIYKGERFGKEEEQEDQSMPAKRS
ncbi:30S ribosomal protein S3 [Patescibacteria group bacterium]